MEIDTSTTHPHPNPVPNPHHRKLELQSPLDLSYLQSNIAASARQKLDLHFPPNASQPQSQTAQQTTNGDPSPFPAESESDPLRARVSQLVSLFLDRTFTAAKHSISVNGLDATSLPSPQDSTSTSAQTNPTALNGTTQDLGREGIDFTYAPYDPRLSSKLASLYAELESLTTTVSKLRRTAPQAAADSYHKALLEAIEKDEVEAAAAAEDVGQLPEGKKGNGNGNVLQLDQVSEEWQREVEGMYERGVGGLRRLGGLSSNHPDGEGGGGGAGGGSLTETVGKVQRAKVVAMELK